jgi:hypothetical protein
MSLGAHIVLLNSVFNTIPIFYISYLKIPTIVSKKIHRIQREFLWGSRRGQKRISWIKWDVLCLPKKKGGLGVRDVHVVNISLLTKLRRRLLFDDQAVWKEVLKSKYGVSVVGQPNLGDKSKPWFSSLWWKDICSIGANLDNNWVMVYIQAFGVMFGLGKFLCGISFPGCFPFQLKRWCWLPE